MEYGPRDYQRNCLSHWFPVLRDAGLPVPGTEIVKSDGCLSSLLHGVEPDGFSALLDGISEAVRKIEQLSSCGNVPVFLRTGQVSGKHNWRECCCLMPDDSVGDHVRSFVEWSAMVDFLGLPTDVWAVREMLPVSPIVYLKRYGGMPLVSEVRCFIDGGEVTCVHPYWPMDAIREGFSDDQVSAGLSADHCYKLAVAGCFSDGGLPLPDVMRLARDVACLFEGDGSWSVDILRTDRGFFVTDMADASMSFHWPGCENGNAETD